MKVLVTGSTGFIGLEVSRRLAGAGLEPRLLVRRPQRAALLRPLDAELVSGDLASAASLARAVRGVDVVIHLGARAAFESYHRVKPTIVDGTRRLYEESARAGVGHFVFASSLLVYDSQPRPIDGDTVARPVVDYGRAKLEAEEYLLEQADRSGPSVGIVRLPHVYGARDLLFERVHSGRVVLVGKGDNLYAHLHVEDAARVLIQVARRSWRGVSAVADRRPASWVEFFEILRSHYPRFRPLRVPTAVAMAGTQALRPLLALRSRPSVLTPDTVRGWNLELPVEPELLWSELGIQPRFATVDEGIPSALDECVAFRWQHPLADGMPY